MAWKQRHTPATTSLKAQQVSKKVSKTAEKDFRICKVPGFMVKGLKLIGQTEGLLDVGRQTAFLGVDSSPRTEGESLN